MTLISTVPFVNEKSEPKNVVHLQKHGNVSSSRPQDRRRGTAVCAWNVSIKFSGLSSIALPAQGCRLPTLGAWASGSGSGCPSRLLERWACECARWWWAWAWVCEWRPPGDAGGASPNVCVM